MITRGRGEIGAETRPGVWHEAGGEGVVDEVGLDGEVDGEEGDGDHG